MASDPIGSDQHQGPQSIQHCTFDLIVTYSGAGFCGFGGHLLAHFVGVFARKGRCQIIHWGWWPIIPRP